MIYDDKSREKYTRGHQPHLNEYTAVSKENMYVQSRGDAGIGTGNYPQ